MRERLGSVGINQSSADLKIAFGGGGGRFLLPGKDCGQLEKKNENRESQRHLLSCANHVDSDAGVIVGGDAYSGCSGGILGQDLRIFVVNSGGGIESENLVHSGSEGGVVEFRATSLADDLGFGKQTIIRHEDNQFLFKRLSRANRHVQIGGVVAQRDLNHAHASAFRNDKRLAQQVLAAAAYGLDIPAEVRPRPRHVLSGRNAMHTIVGCVRGRCGRSTVVHDEDRKSNV